MCACDFLILTNIFKICDKYTLVFSFSIYTNIKYWKQEVCKLVDKLPLEPFGEMAQQPDSVTRSQDETLKKKKIRRKNLDEKSRRNSGGKKPKN